MQKHFEPVDEEDLASHAVIGRINVGLSLSDKEGHFILFNGHMQKITGYTMDEINRQDLCALLYPDPEDRRKAMHRLSQISPEKGASDIETIIKTKDGSLKGVSVTTSLIDYKGKDMFLSVWRDVTGRKLLQDDLRNSETRFRRLFETAQDGILLLDADTGRITEANKFLIDMLGYSHEEFLGKQLWEMGAFVDIERCKLAFKELQAKGYVRYEDLPLKTKNGRLVNVEFVSNVYKVDNTNVIQCNIRDITNRRRAEDERELLIKSFKYVNSELEQLAVRDSHTGLYNHRYLKDALEANFTRAERQSGLLSVVMMDLDYFKSINDVYGHLFGDVVLKQFAMLLSASVRPYDIAIRYGGEEFIVISPDTGRGGALSLAGRILEKTQLHYFGDKIHSVKLKLSLAVVSYPEDDVRTGMGLVDLADRILNKAKESGGNRVYSSVDVKGPSRTARRASTAHWLKEKIRRLTKRANQSLIEETFAFAKALELKDFYTGEHVEKTVHYAARIAQELNYPNEKIELVKQAAMLHDLGKVGISDKILQKKSKLTQKEFDEIKKHPQIGVDIIRPIQSLRPVIPALLHHHERWDGKGYPDGLKARQIPLLARITSLADVYQALTSDRPYRKAFSEKQAVAIVKKASGTQFDPDVVDSFIRVLQSELHKKSDQSYQMGRPESLSKSLLREKTLIKH